MALSPWQLQWLSPPLAPAAPLQPAALGPGYTWDQFDVFRNNPLVDGFSDVRHSAPRSRKPLRTPYGNAATNVSSLAFWMTTLGLINSRYLEPSPPKEDTPPFKTRFKWKTVDFEFLSPLHRAHALASGDYILENVLPLGLETWGSRLWVTLPRWRPGVPATLATVSLRTRHASPRLAPYPDWTFHSGDNSSACDRLTSVFRLAADPCGRLWVLDSGKSDILGASGQTCPPALFLFDLATDRLLARLPIPKALVPQDSLYSSIVVDSDEQCSDLHVYLGDPWRFGLVVFREADQRFWRFSHHLFFPDPFASNYTLHDLNFQWTDGLFSLALTPLRPAGSERRLYFHAMSSFNEFYVSTTILKNPELVDKSATQFHLAGEDRGPFGQSSTAVIDRRGVMFNGLVTRDSIGCWDTNKPYKRDLLGVVAQDERTLVFPNDLKIDERSRRLWVLSNRLPMFQADQVDFEDYNYRIMYVDTEEAVRGTICDPNQQLPYLSLVIY